MRSLSVKIPQTEGSHFHTLSKISNLIRGLKVGDHFYQLRRPRGRPSLSPESYLRMQILIHLFDIRSERALCRELELNETYRNFCLVNYVPHYSTLSKVRKRLGSVFIGEIFDQIVKLSIDIGAANPEEILTDSTIVNANASMNSLKKIEGEDDSKWKRYPSNKTHRSTTDPDATLASKNGTLKGLKYKAHVSIEGSNRLIVDCYLTSGSKHDAVVYLDRLEHIQNLTKIQIKKVQADRAYGSLNILKILYMQRIKPFIPFFHSKGGTVKGLDVGFSYDRKNDRYICPMGKYLYAYNSKTLRYKRYSAKAKECYICTKRNSCLNIKIKTLRPKWINRNIDQDFMDKHLFV